MSLKHWEKSGNRLYLETTVSAKRIVSRRFHASYQSSGSSPYGVSRMGPDVQDLVASNNVTGSCQTWGPETARYIFNSAVVQMDSTKEDVVRCKLYLIWREQSGFTGSYPLAANPHLYRKFNGAYLYSNYLANLPRWSIIMRRIRCVES